MGLIGTATLPGRALVRTWLRAGAVAVRLGAQAVQAARTLVDGHDQAPAVTAEPHDGNGAATAPPRREPAVRVRPTRVDEEAVPVAEFAEPGAEDGAGPEIAVAEPWEGYDRMPVREVQRRLASAGPEVVAAVRLYESAHRARQTLIQETENLLRDS